MKKKKWFYIGGIILLLGILLFEFLKGVPKEKVTEEPLENVLSYSVKDWQHDYYVLLQEFMAGGFLLDGYINYLDSDKDNFYFSLLDINDDETPELLIKYDNSWSVFTTGNTYDEAYLGEIMYYDYETKYAFWTSGYMPNWVSAYRFDGSELVLEYELGIEYQYDVVENTYDCEKNNGEDIEQFDLGEGEETIEITKYIVYEKNKKGKEISKYEFDKYIKNIISDSNLIEGKRLSVENVIYELGVDPDAFHEEIAMRGYNGLIYCYQKNGGEYANTKYALIDINNDVPALACVNDESILLCLYHNGKLKKFEQKGYGIEKRDYFYYPHKSMVRESEHELGYYEERFFYLEDGGMKEVFSAVEEPICALIGINRYKKDIFGNVQYNYYINDQIVSKRNYEKQRNNFLKEYDLCNGAVSFKEEVEFGDYLDMKIELENMIANY